MSQLEADLKRLQRLGDADADAVIAQVQARRGAEIAFQLMGEVMQWMPGRNERGLDPEILAFLKHEQARPTWFDEKRVLSAQHTYQKNRNAARSVLGVYSLPSLYVHTDIALTLIGTGRLATDVRRRLNETQMFIDAVMRPGALGAAGMGWQWIRKVRLSHAIRRAMAKLPDASGPGVNGFFAGFVRNDPLAVLHARKGCWQPGEDEPVDQVELAYVLLTFSWVVADGVSRLGYRMSRQQREDHLHTWAVVGHMLGIADELLPGGPSMPASAAKDLFERLRERCLKRGDPLPKPGTS